MSIILHIVYSEVIKYTAAIKLNKLIQVIINDQIVSCVKKCFQNVSKNVSKMCQKMCQCPVQWPSNRMTSLRPRRIESTDAWQNLAVTASHDVRHWSKIR